MRLMLLIALLLAAVCGCSPEDDPFLEDPAGLLDVSARERLARYHAVLLRDLDIHFKAVFLAEASGDIDRTAVDLFERYRLGERTRAARGVLLVVDPAGQQVRLEIGYDLEGVFPDGFVGRVEEEQMVPFFAAGRIGAGVAATVELLVARALQVGSGAAATARRPGRGGDRWSGGGGAKTAILPVSPAVSDQTPADPQRFAPRTDPLSTLQVYVQVLAARVKEPDLGLYTPETRRFLRRWLVTDAQQANEFRKLTAALPGSRVLVAGDRAVVRFSGHRPPGRPYLLERGESGWMLDWPASPPYRLQPQEPVAFQNAGAPVPIRLHGPAFRPARLFPTRRLPSRASRAGSLTCACRRPDRSR